MGSVAVGARDGRVLKRNRRAMFNWRANVELATGESPAVVQNRTRMTN